MTEKSGSNRDSVHNDEQKETEGLPLGNRVRIDRKGKDTPLDQVDKQVDEGLPIGNQVIID